MSERPTEFAGADLLPSSVPKETKSRVFRGSVPWIPIFCANCGKEGGWVPEEAKDFAFYLCDSPCAEKWTHLADTYAVPDEVFWEKVKQAQLEKYGRILSPDETVEALKDEQHILTKLGRERLGWKNKKERR